MKAAICCSVRFRDLIAETMRQMEAAGIEPLFPNIAPPADKDPLDLIPEHFAALHEADAVYLLLPEGKAGSGVTLEFGYALGLGKPVYLSQSTGQAELDALAAGIVPPDLLEQLHD